MKILGPTLALGGLVLSAGIAYAMMTVTFDPITGTGFVGKGDVQLAYGWNNAQAQANIPALTFTYENEETYEAVCTFVTGAGTNGEKTHTVTRPRHVSVNATVQHSARSHKQIDGIYLAGFGSNVVEGAVPVLGDPCAGGPDGGSWTSVTYVGGTGGGLTAWYNGVPAVLTPTPAL